ncbi:hypothetical protein PG985_006260 [Apiospora marii]|uniref:Secreted protein n=1 Tax=Apiospora marii TaxID=335849 RepID=A0ABR1S737_9PEZI
MRPTSFLFICFAISGNCFTQRVFETVRGLRALSGPIPPYQTRSCHDGRSLDLSQGAGVLCYTDNGIAQASHYTSKTTLEDDNNDNHKVGLERPRPDQWMDKLLADLKKASKLIVEIAEFAQELMKSVTAKSRQAAAEQMRHSLENMPLRRQERISQLLKNLHEVLEDVAQLLERSGDRTTSAMQWIGMHGGLGKLPEQLLEETAQWLRQHDGGFQGDTAQVLVDKTLSTAWLLLKVQMIVAPQTVWSPVLSALGWGTKGVRKGSAAAALHSKPHPVVARSWFATTQSAAQNGYGKPVFNRIFRSMAAIWLTQDVDWEFMARWFEETDLVPQSIAVV